MLDDEDDEDVACTVEDMEAVVRDLWFRGDGGKGKQGYKERNDGTVLGCRLRKAVQTPRGAVKDYGIICSRPSLRLHQPTLKRRAPSRITATVLEYCRSG